MKEVHIPKGFEGFISRESAGLDVLEVREIGKLHSSCFTLQEAV